MTTRQEKYQAFSSFASEAESRFIALMESTPRAQTLANMHSFYVTSGSQVGIDDRWVTVFFGKRPVNLSNGGTTILAESGAALHYSQAEDGSVACFVYPARTANRQPLDEIVMIWRYCEPEYMASYGPIANDFSAFISFAVWSGLDTKPTFLEDPCQRRTVDLQYAAQWRDEATSPEQDHALGVLRRIERVAPYHICSFRQMNRLIELATQVLS